MGWVPELVREWLVALPSLIPFLLVAAVGIGALTLADWLLLRRGRARVAHERFGRQLALLSLSAGVIVLAILALPVGDTTRGQLLSLFGLLLTAVIALSSTTFVANAMAGLMLRAVGSFRPGDFVRVADQFGRVTEMGLFHTEIQTEDRDLATLPNLYLVTQPVAVVRASGTIVSASLSLGYDVAHGEVEPLLLQAARAAGLEDPFVHVLELGDFSVGYRVAGFLAEVKHLLSTRSRLRVEILDALHGAGVEIVSPTFMNQRSVGERKFVPAPIAAAAPTPEPTPIEERVFDKAEQAARTEALRAELEALEKQIAELEKADPRDEPQLLRLRGRRDALAERLAARAPDGAAGD